MMAAIALALVMAATPIDLEAARRESRRNVQALRAALDRELARQDVRAARSGLLPQLSFSAGAGGAYIGPQRIFTTVPDPGAGTGFSQRVVDTPAATRGSFELSLGLSQILYDRALWSRLRQAGALAEAADGQTVEEEASAELEGIRRFYVLYRSQAALEVLRKTVERSEEQLSRARALFEAGRAGKGDTLTAEVNLGNDRISVLQGESQLAGAQADLAVWLARTGLEELRATAPASLERPPPEPMALAEAVAQAREGRPLLVALERQVSAAEYGVSVARAGYWPQLAASGSYSRQGPSPDLVFADPSRQNTLSAGLTLRWDLFSGLATDASAVQAEQRRARARLDLAQAERELEAEVRRNYQVLKAQISATRVAAANREAAAGALTLAEGRFRAGAGSTLEVRDAQLKLTQSELSLLGARIDADVASYGLRRSMGALSAGESK